MAELKKYKFNFISGVNTLFNALLHTPGFDTVDFSACVPLSPAAWRVQAVGGGALEGSHGLRNDPRLGTDRDFAHGHRQSHRLPSSMARSGCPCPPPMSRFAMMTAKKLPVNGVGEICVFGPQVMRGYWNRPDETEKVMFGDWLRTGDIGRMDDEGLRLHRGPQEGHDPGVRLQCLSERGRERRAAHPGVLEVAAVAQPDEDSGEAVALFVVKKDPNLTAEALIAFCRKELTGYKVPKHVYFRSELPKTNVGKILRRALRDELRAAAGTGPRRDRQADACRDQLVVRTVSTSSADALRIDLRRDAVPQIEHVARARRRSSRAPAAFRRAAFGRRKQRRRIEIALQGHPSADGLARRAQVGGPVHAHRIAADGGDLVQPGAAAFGEDDVGHAPPFGSRASARRRPAPCSAARILHTAPESARRPRCRTT